MKKKFSMGLALSVVLVVMLASAAAAAPVGDTVSNTLGLTVNVEEAAVDPTIFVNDDLADTSAVGLYDCFTVGTTPGDYGDTPVRVKMEADPATGFALEYVEQDPDNPDYGQYLDLNVDNGVAWFGPGTGFPLGAVSDSMFRVTWNAADTYTFTLSIMAKGDGEEFDQELDSTSVTVTVVSGEPVALTHAVGEGALVDTAVTAEVAAGSEIDYTVAAALANGVSHVDGALYICEVQEESEGSWVAAAKEDFVITAADGGDPQGINNTFNVEGDVLRGYWGPSSGFTLEESLSTTMTVRFDNAGSYKSNVYAIQVEPAARAF